MRYNYEFFTEILKDGSIILPYEHPVSQQWKKVN
jgi:hypothetical protein